MLPVDMIAVKRNGGRHSREELEEFLNAYVQGQVADYQVSAWLMAVYLRGMDDQETADLTQVMAASGDMLDLSEFPSTVDKHSTGGVGDKTSLVLSPLLAEAGATVAKMSGRGLGHTGGTVDKLESIPGFRVGLSDDEFLAQARNIRVVITGQSKDMAPADGLLYSLRDATATVDSVPLIASSIMSKKLAGGAKSIVLDVKVGKGAFMRTPEEAGELARAMIAIGRLAGRNVSALLSSMEQPLGQTVGNALEVQEAIACLRGGGPGDLRELCLQLAQQLTAAADLDVGRAALEDLLDSGRAFERFLKWIEAQGGDVAAAEKLPLAGGEAVVTARQAGTVASLDALLVGRAAGVLGGGRSRKEDAVDHGVGVVLHRKIGDEVEAGEPLATLHHRDGRGLESARRLVNDAFGIGYEVAEQPLVLGVVDG